ncbi:hypothetical protein OG492_47415 [Streptomyces chartreusis]
MGQRETFGLDVATAGRRVDWSGGGVDCTPAGPASTRQELALAR